MISHATFMMTLVQLIEYAERNNLQEEALALAEAAEVVAPSIGVSRPIPELSAQSFGRVILFPQQRRPQA